MSSQGSPLPPRHTLILRTAAPALAAVAVAGAGCVWTVGRAVARADRPLVAGSGALAAVLLGAVVALALSRRRLARALHAGLAELREDAARTQALHAEAARRAAGELETARRAVREADARRRAAAGAETAARTALHEQTARATALEAEAAGLAESVLPLAVRRVRAGEAPAAVLATAAAPDSPALRAVLDAVVTEAASGERLRAAGTAVCAEAAARVQALTTRMLADLREMEQRHDERVLDDLLRLDHCTAQAGRLADSVAVLTGARTGRRWTRPIPMENVLRGAVGRIHAYQRVRLHSTSTASVAGHAAEGVMHALAELMDNACNFSPPTEDVHVYVEEARAGLVVTVEDAGRTMADPELARARRLVGDDPLDLRRLGAPRLGLAVVGCLARKHGLRVSFRPSSRGGTGVVVLIPAGLATRVPVEAPAERQPGRPDAYGPGPAGVPGTRSEHAGAADGADAGADAALRPYRGRHGTQGRPAAPEPRPGPDPGTPYGEALAADPGGPQADPASGLPRRTRGQGLAAAMEAEAGPGSRPDGPAARARAAAETTAGERFGAFRDAAAGRPAPDGPVPGDPVPGNPAGSGRTAPYGPADGPVTGGWTAPPGPSRGPAGHGAGGPTDTAANRPQGTDWPPDGTNRPQDATGWARDRTDRTPDATNRPPDGTNRPSDGTAQETGGAAGGPATRLSGREGRGRTGWAGTPRPDAPVGGPAPSAGRDADGRGTSGGGGTASTGGETEP